MTLAHEMNRQAPIACPSSWCPTRGLRYSWKRWSSVLRRWSLPSRHAPQPVCVEAEAGLASKAWTTRSSQLQMVKNSGNPHWFHCQPTPPGSGQHRNDAIRENTFALFVSICIRTATFIVGKPNTSSPCSCRWTCSLVRWLQLKQQKLSFQEHEACLFFRRATHWCLFILLDREIEVNGQFVHLCIIGMSNRRVDPAKSNRATCFPRFRHLQSFE